MTSGSRASSVFLNVPYDRGYQDLFVTLVTTLVCLGQTPRCVVEVKEGVQGRLDRIFKLLQSCPASIHDLSRVGPPPRWNMPFELGLACSLALTGGTHQVVVMDSRPHRLQKHLSDYGGRDPVIHHGRCDDMVTAILDIYEVPNEPDPELLRNIASRMRRESREIARKFRRDDVFSASVFRAIVAAAIQHAEAAGFIASR